MTKQNMDSWLRMMLMCGPLIAFLRVSDGSRLPRSRYDNNQKLSANIHQLQLHYNTNGAEWVGRSVFTPHLDQLSSRGSCTCQSMMLEGMLNIYEEIFTDMLNKSEKKELKSSVKDIMSEVKNLKHKYSEEHRFWRDLQEIHFTKVKNGTVQGAALNEFLMVFNRAYTEKY